MRNKVYIKVKRGNFLSAGAGEKQGRETLRGNTADGQGFPDRELSDIGHTIA
jgi:hypothetical protein